MNDDMLIYGGGGVKALGEGKFGGHAILFTTPYDVDLQSDYFTKDSDLELEGRSTLPGFYAHATDPTIKGQRLGYLAFKTDGVGLWVEGVLDQRDRYAEKIHELIAAGVLGFSTGAVGHLVRRVAKKVGEKTVNWLSYWPIGEVSLTPMPAEPRTLAVALKSYEPLTFKECVRRRGMSEAELMREESLRLRAHAEVTLGLREAPDSFSIRQARSANSHRRRVAEQALMEIDRQEAKAKLLELDELKTKYERLIAAQKARPTRPQLIPGALPKWYTR